MKKVPGPENWHLGYLGYCRGGGGEGTRKLAPGAGTTEREEYRKNQVRSLCMQGLQC
jgi:hypothetical protein